MIPRYPYRELQILFCLNFLMFFFTSISLSKVFFHLASFFQDCHFPFNSVIFKVWSPDQQHPYHLETCQKFLDTTPNLLNQKCWASDLDGPIKFENHQFKSFWFGFSVTCGQNFLLLQGSSAGKESTCNGGLNPQFNFWMGKIPCRRDMLPILVFLGFPGGSDSKESTCNVGDLGLIPG